MLTILGSTGSIGCSTLSVLDQAPGLFCLYALTAHRDVERLYEQCIKYQPRYAVLVDETAAKALKERLKGSATQVLAGKEALVEVASAPEVGTVMAAIVGAAGLLPTLAAAQAGKRILLANKEALVMAGDLFLRAVREQRAVLLPVDSEHNAIFQCLPEGRVSTEVVRIILTASGGPFRELPFSEWKNITPEQAYTHPNWSMGKKISIDSATMMNKGLEIIEAHHLFGLPLDKIDVVIHPQSIVHSLVEYVDGSVLAQMGCPDMRTPIACVLAHPTRLPSGVKRLDLTAQPLHFSPLCLKRYPCVQLTRDALKESSAAVIILNAANEVVVEQFLQGKIAFMDIAARLEKILSRCERYAVRTLEEILAQDAEARRIAL